MHYVMGDIHNDNIKFEAILEKIELSEKDHLYVLGDLFDRCNAHPDPVGVYFNILKLKDRVSVIMGNHDLWLADYIDKYYSLPERKRKRATPYSYNSFEIIKERLTEVDMIQLSAFIKTFPLQMSLDIGEEHYLLAHAMTASPNEEKPSDYYIKGDDNSRYHNEGINGYISLCGHTDSSCMRPFAGKFSDDTKPSIWKNENNNLFMMDCGCGFESGRLACICLESKEEYYA